MHFTSPRKSRDKRKTRTLISPPGKEKKRRELQETFQRLKSGGPSSPIKPDSISDSFTYQESTDLVPDTSEHIQEDITSQSAPATPKRRTAPDDSAKRLYANWKSVIPTLCSFYITYYNNTSRKPLQQLDKIKTACDDRCERKLSSITCLFFDPINVISCKCVSIPQILVLHGLFPSAPSQPRIAISMELLTFYRALFERSCDAINALASALNNFYTRRGFRMTDSKGEAIHEPFRRSLGQAVQWFDILQIMVEQQLDQTLQSCREHVREALIKARGMLVSAPLKSSLVPGCAASILQQRCPACFGHSLWGRKLVQGGDVVHVASDGNFHHRHRRSAGDSPPFYDPVYVLPKHQVDAVGSRIERLRKRPPRAYKSPIPDEALDQCERTYEAVDGKKQKAAMDSFDDTGVMALICRHDIPLFFANIDTPGEQQKYSIALFEHLFSLLPQAATVTGLYDVGCVLSRSLAQYEFLPDQITARLQFRTTAMHAYGHDWACQLIYNPRMSLGLGLSDGEGVERLWSRIRKLITLERSSARNRRIWLLDRQAAAIGEDLRKDLGDWIRQRSRRGIQEQGNKADNILEECGLALNELETLWKEQKSSQLSLRAHAPMRLKKELDTVLVLQAELDASDKALQATRTTISASADKLSGETVSALESLKRGHERLVNKVEKLYASLNVHEKFPELKNVDLEFVRTLLMARDLKINIRKRAIGSFFEWVKLDQAVGGHQQALGTKLHQHTRKAIAKRQPALMTALRKFSTYCEHLEELYDPTWNIPLPKPLPTKLSALRDDQRLMEDVWITPAVQKAPRWLEDQDVRDGIRAMLKCQRCNEEEARLQMEAENLCEWFRHELSAVELALRIPNNSTFTLMIQHLRENLMILTTRWATTYTPSSRFHHYAKEAISVAIFLSGQPLALQPEQTFTKVVLIDDTNTLDDAIPFPDEFELDEVAPEHLAITDTLAGDTEFDIGGVEIECEDDENIVDAEIQWTSSTVSVGNPIQRTTNSLNGLQRITFEPRELAILASPTARLNDGCINGCAQLLQRTFVSAHAERCAVLSSHDLLRIHYNASDEVLWKGTYRTDYWLKDIWIIPVHRPAPVRHWVLCIVSRTTRELFLFDSFAERQQWRSDVKDIMQLVSRMLVNANRRHGPFQVDMSGWTAKPIMDHALQTNSYDCGLWVLAIIAAVIRGSHWTDLQEGDMPAFQHYLQILVLSIPVVVA
ncbi:hypothetical protein BJ138DRAFT_1017919 [Hygrophoropsis aurantiaca]|uniref:Uncharacterized protein n=1 Tax=Hygrophoropsis aurantiaca TaxID=72124 RepID=A0ACB7ZWY4_9AGAM|nr:hypothetical protein BJ138DRAFT_1017919 [Hygrophoropsis aurantiaca]